MKRLSRSFLAMALAALACACTAQEPTTATPDAHPTSLELHSEVLDEPRSLSIALPDSYQPGRSYPVVYVTDGESNFPLVAEYLRYSSSNWPRLPEMIVVGVNNVDRNRDFVPRPDPNFPGTGNADAFMDFVESELIPAIEAELDVTGPRILVGHSFGGTNAIHFALTRPDVFDAHIAIGSSTWVANRALFEIAEQAFEQPADDNTWLYMSVAEADGGATVPDGKAFAELLEASAPSRLDWRFEIIPETTHFNAVPPSVHNAFEQLFPAWRQGQSLRASIDPEQPDTVDQWFASMEEQLGFRFMAQPWDLMMESYALAGEGHHDVALRLLSRLRDLYPGNSSLALAEGDIHRVRQRPEHAMRAYADARDIAISEGEHRNTVTTIENRISLLE